MKIYLIRRLYNLRMKESDSVQAHLNEYESLSSQISSQGTLGSTSVEPPRRLSYTVPIPIIA